jgi:S-adenosyl methyltransferase
VTQQEQIDVTVASSARVYDCLLGGKDNFEADRKLAAQLTQLMPDLPIMFRAQRDLMGRIVRHLAQEHAVRQFLDIGTGIPTSPNVHEIAQLIDAASRVVYVDNDPMVMAHARALMRGTAEGRTCFLAADVRDPDQILDDPDVGTTLDTTKPIGVLLIGIVHHIRDEEHPYDIVRRIVDWLPAGSYIAISTPSADFDPERMNAIAQIGERSGLPVVPRSKSALAGFFHELELLPPGIVPLLAWHPDTEPEDVNAVHGWVGVARKPHLAASTTEPGGRAAKAPRLR